jgi:TPR repeat protein
MSAGSPISTPKWIAASLAIVAALWLMYAGRKHELASHYALSSNPANWERATRIEPDNPELWYRLARFRHLDFDNADIPSAIAYYRRAAQLNPRSPYFTGNCLECGNFLPRQNRAPEAFAEIHRATQTRANEAIRYCPFTGMKRRFTKYVSTGI